MPPVSPNPVGLAAGSCDIPDPGRDWLLTEGKSGYTSTRNPELEARRGNPADDDLPVELYNLRQDLPQKNNLAAAHPDRVAELRTLLKQIRT